jgi:hypothetical protein
VRNPWSLALLVAALGAVLSASPPVNVTGTWTGDLKGQEGGTARVRVVLRQEGDRISGTAGPIDKQNPAHIYDARFEGEHLLFALRDTDEDGGLALTYRFDLKVTNDRMQGNAYGRSGDRSWKLDVALTREK